MAHSAEAPEGSYASTQHRRIEQLSGLSGRWPGVWSPGFQSSRVGFAKELYHALGCSSLGGLAPLHHASRRRPVLTSEWKHRDTAPIKIHTCIGLMNATNSAARSTPGVPKVSFIRCGTEEAWLTVPALPIANHWSLLHIPHSMAFPTRGQEPGHSHPNQLDRPTSTREYTSLFWQP